MSKEVKVASLTILAGVILFVGVRFLKGIAIFSNINTYYVVYNDIDGLKTSNPVILNGLPVGRVSHIDILQDQNNKLLVTMEIKDNLIIKDKTVALLTDPDLLGDKAIALTIKGNSIAESGDTLVSKIDKGLTGVLEAKANPIIEALDSTLTSLNAMLKEYKGMGENVQKTVDNAAVITGKVAQIDVRDLQTSLKNLKVMSEEMAAVSKDLKPLSEKMNAIADSVQTIPMGEISNELQTSLVKLDNILKAIDEAEGSLGLLVKDEKLYNDLDQTVKDLDKLFVDLRENPKRYVHFSLFGKKDKSAKKEKDNDDAE
ncbi:MAG: mammalian cell entry protein [Thalassobius sp.]|nr:mammalian cell entry protein [Thalassovita sp.]